MENWMLCIYYHTLKKVSLKTGPERVTYVMEEGPCPQEWEGLFSWTRLLETRLMHTHLADPPQQRGTRPPCPSASLLLAPYFPGQFTPQTTLNHCCLPSLEFFLPQCHAHGIVQHVVYSDCLPSFVTCMEESSMSWRGSTDHSFLSMSSVPSLARVHPTWLFSHLWKDIPICWAVFDHFEGRCCT